MTGRETYGEGKEHLMSIKHITLSVMLEMLEQKWFLIYGAI